jgi:hypothetical protein
MDQTTNRRTATDKAALNRALALIIEGDDKTQALHYRQLLKEDGFERTAIRAAATLQHIQLNLRPWHRPPAYAAPNDGSQAGQVAALLIKAGYSKFEPNVIEALEQRRLAG